jgi:hypothetical protein
VIGTLLERAEVSDDGDRKGTTAEGERRQPLEAAEVIGDGDRRRRRTDFDIAPATPFPLVYRCSKSFPKAAIFAIFRGFRAASRRQGLLGNTLQDREIGHDPGAPGLGGPFKNPVGRGAPKLPHRFPLFVHYPSE